MIYIKDMDMPVDCLACRISCKHESYLVTGRPKDCPLEEAKTGDLISRADAIEAVKEILSGNVYWDYVCDAVNALSALPSAEASQDLAKPIKALKGSDLISRADAIETVCRTRCGDKAKGCPAHSCLVIEEFESLQSAETHDKRTETHGVCLISKDDAIEAVAQQWLFEASAESPYVNDDDIDDYRKLAEELLSDIPSAEAVQGEWIFRTDIPIGGGRESAGYVCSNCRKDYFHVDGMNFCPNCGAKMKGGAE